MIDINNLKTADDLRAALEGLSVERRMIILSDDFAGISILSERLKEATEVRTELLVDAARDVLEAARVSAAQALSNEIGPAFNQDDMTDDQREIFEETMFQIAANQWTGYMEAQIMRLTNSGHGDQVKVFKGYMGTLLLALQLHCPLYLTYPSGKKAGELVYVALNRVRKYTEDFRDMMANINAEKQRAAAKRAGLTVRTTTATPTVPRPRRSSASTRRTCRTISRQHSNSSSPTCGHSTVPATPPASTSRRCSCRWSRRSTIWRPSSTPQQSRRFAPPELPELRALPVV